MIVFHAFSNVFNTWLLTFLAEPQTATLIIALMPWTIVIFKQSILGKAHFPGKPQWEVDSPIHLIYVIARYLRQSF